MISDYVLNARKKKYKLRHSYVISILYSEVVLSYILYCKRKNNNSCHICSLTSKSDTLKIAMKKIGELFI